MALKTAVCRTKDLWYSSSLLDTFAVQEPVESFQIDSFGDERGEQSAGFDEIARFACSVKVAVTSTIDLNTFEVVRSRSRSLKVADIGEKAAVRRTKDGST